jgi:hypothetical protein
MIVLGWLQLMSEREMSNKSCVCWKEMGWISRRVIIVVM